MANILINGTLAPNGPFQIVNATDVFANVQTFLNNTARDAWLSANSYNAVAGLYANVYNTGGATSVTYQLQNDLVTWTAVTFGASTLTGDVTGTNSAGTINTTITSAAVSLAKMANLAANIQDNAKTTLTRYFNK